MVASSTSAAMAAITNSCLKIFAVWTTMIRLASRQLLKWKLLVRILAGLTSTVPLSKFLTCQLTQSGRTSFCLPMEQSTTRMKLCNWLLRTPVLIEDYTRLEWVMEQMRHLSRNALLKALEISTSSLICQKLNTKSSTLYQTLSSTTKSYKI